MTTKEPEQGASLARRASIYTMLSCHILALKIPRLAIPSLVPFMVESLGLPQSTVPTLLAAFHPGYVAANLPGGPLVQAVGAKAVGLLGLLGTAACFALFPSAARSKRATAQLVQIMMVMGILQGPLSPTLMDTNSKWIPTKSAADKIERTWSIRFQSLMHSFSPALAVAIAPRLASRFGWAMVCRVFAGGVAGYAVLWQLFFANAPPAVKAPPARPAPPQTGFKLEMAEGEEGAAAGSDSDGGGSGELEPALSKKKVEYAILGLPNSLSLILYHIAFDNLAMTMIQLTPTIFMDKGGFGLSAVEMSKYVGAAQMCHVPAGFAVSAIDSLLIKAGVPPLSVRRAMTCGGSVLEAFWAVMFARARTPLAAAVSYACLDCCSQLHGSGAWTNFMEHGAEDAALLNSVSNTLASLTAVVVPHLGFALRQRTGSWAPMLLGAAVLKLISGAIFGLTVTVTPARVQLQRRRLQRQLRQQKQQ